MKLKTVVKVKIFIPFYNVGNIIGNCATKEQKLRRTGTIRCTTDFEANKTG